jgi:hypothetical protein
MAPDMMDSFLRHSAEYILLRRDFGYGGQVAHKIANPKLQISNKLQAPISNNQNSFHSGFQTLAIGAYLVFVAPDWRFQSALCAMPCA